MLCLLSLAAGSDFNYRTATLKSSGCSLPTALAAGSCCCCSQQIFHCRIRQEFFSATTLLVMERAKPKGTHREDLVLSTQRGDG